MKEITDIIATVGFPIVAFGGLAYFGGKYGFQFVKDFINRIMDENKQREVNMFAFMSSMGEKMEKMSENMENLGEMIQKHIDKEHGKNE